MKGNFRRVKYVLAAVFCIGMVGCGAEKEAESPAYIIGGASEESGEENTGAEGESGQESASLTQSEESSSSGKYLTEEDLDKWVQEELEKNGYSEAESTKDSREVITVGVFHNFVGTNMETSVGNYNISQDKYWLEIKEYDSHSNLVMDIMRGEGADIFSLKHMSFDLFADAGVLEDLTPYFEKSEVISKEQVLPSVWRAGAWEGKYMGVIPYFNPVVNIVEKGVSDNGGWTLEEYFALGDKYPDSKLDENVQNFNYYFPNFFDAVQQSFVDWEEMKCNFDCESFRTLLSNIKANAEKSYKDAEGGSIADALYAKDYLVYDTILYCDHTRKMQTYLSIRDTFLENYDLLGVPNKDGEPRYDMHFYEMYGINALSDKKEAAWSFIEYLFSEEYQSELHSSSFTARADMLEKMFEEEINYDFSNSDVRYTNRFTKEKCWGSKSAPFTKEDQEKLQYILDNCYRNTMHYSELYYIVEEEAEYYFAGDKTLDEVVKIIQSRADIYMEENKVD